jgi:hypothetical protein
MSKIKLAIIFEERWKSKAPAKHARAAVAAATKYASVKK